MKCWPLPQSYGDDLPKSGSQGSFWEERSDRYNCGVDLFAPSGAEVLAIEDGRVIDAGIFTDTAMENYFNLTYFIVVRSEEKLNYKYAGLADICVRTGDTLRSGQRLGTLDSFINGNKVTDKEPFHIREMAYKDLTTFLHIEIYKSPIIEVRPYSCGNFTGGGTKPPSLLDPANVLLGLRKQMSF